MTVIKYWKWEADLSRIVFMPGDFDETLVEWQIVPNRVLQTRTQSLCNQVLAVKVKSFVLASVTHLQKWPIWPTDPLPALLGTMPSNPHYRLALPRSPWAPHCYIASNASGREWCAVNSLWWSDGERWVTEMMEARSQKRLLPSQECDSGRDLGNLRVELS